MAQRTRNFLFTGPFSNGQRPDENDFRDVWESFINYQDDPISLDSNNNYVLSNAVRIGNTTGDNPGTIRFNGTIFEFRESGGWETLGSGASGGAFQVVGTGSDIAYNDGNVGINTGTSPTDYRFQVSIGNNDGLANQVRFGSAVIHNRTTSSNVAYFSHQSFADDTNYALSQSALGNVNLNAPTGRSIQFSINNATGMTLTENSDLVVNGTTAINDDGSTSFYVNGNALKTVGGANWRVGSDEKIKKKIRPFKDGLEIIKKINPVRFQYNGKAWTKNGDENIGVSGSEIKKIAPYMVSTARAKLNPKDKKETDILMFDSSALIYVAINAIKELSDKIEALEEKLSN